MLLEHECGISSWHARPIAEITAFVGEHKINTYATCKGKKANADSVLGLMSLNVKFGDKIIFELQGTEESLKKFKAFIKEY